MKGKRFSAPIEVCPDLDNWPKSWMGLEKDVIYGQGVLQAMLPFMEHLIERGLSRKTIRHHLNNLWLLGGEIIRRVSMDEEYDTLPLEMLKKSVDASGGPNCRHLDSDEEVNSYNATCRKLAKFLEEKQSTG